MKIADCQQLNCLLSTHRKLSEKVKRLKLDVFHLASFIFFGGEFKSALKLGQIPFSKPITSSRGTGFAMNTVRQTGASSSFGSVQEAGAQAPIGKAAPKQPATPAPPLSLDPQDQVSQTAGPGGKAAPVGLVAEPGPQNAQIRSLLAKGDFDALAALVNQLGTRGLGQLDLSLSEIKTIAVGLGQEGMFAHFTAEERQAVESLLIASKLDVNQKYEGLNSLLGQEAVLSFARSATPATLSKLSQTHRQEMMKQLVADDSLVGSVMGAASELVNRRMLGNQQVEDRLGSKLLRSTHNEAELRSLLAQMNQFSRDDVTFRYVMDLSAKELAGLSDDFKQELMAGLLDTGISFYGLNIDFNSLGNIDEMLHMTFKEHAEAAKRLYVALKPETRQSQEVQTLVSKSDLMMEQLKGIETSLNADIKAGKVNQAIIDKYRELMKALPPLEDPALKQKYDALQATLNQLQEGLQQANQTRQISTSALTSAHGQLEKTQASLKAAQTKVGTLSASLKNKDAQIDAAEARLMAQLQTLSQLRDDSGALGDELKALLDQAAPLLETASKGSLRGQLPKLDAVLSKVRTAEDKLKALGGEQSTIGQQLQAFAAQISQQREDLTAAMTAFNTDRSQLAKSNDRLKQLLSGYQTQINGLETDYAAARQQLDALDQGALPEAQRAPLQAILDAARKDIDDHQASYTQLQTQLEQTLVPAALKIEAAHVELAPLVTQVEQQADRSEARIETAETTLTVASSATEEVLSVLEQVRQQAAALRQDISARIPTMTSPQLKQASAAIDKMIGDLRAADPTGTESQDELKALGDLKAELRSLTEALSHTGGIQDQLGKALADAARDSQSIGEELGHAQQAMSQASSAVDSAKSSIKEAESKLQSLDTTMKTYETQLQQWEARLTELNQANSTSKDTFRKSLESLKPGGTAAAGKPDPALRQQFEQQKQVLETQFTDADSQRTAIQREIEKLKSQIQTVQTTMGQQKQQLVSYRSTLADKADALKVQQDKVLVLSNQLKNVTTDNRNLLKEAQAKLVNLGSQPKNKEVAAALAQVQDKITALKAQIEQSEQLMGTSRQQVEKLLVSSRDAREALSSLDTEIASIDQFVQTDLQRVHQNLTGLESRFKSFSDTQTQLQNRAQELMAQLAGQRPGSIGFEQIKTELEGIFTQVQDRATLDLLMQAGQTAFSAAQALGGAKSAFETLNDLNQQAHSLASQAHQAAADMRADLAQLTGEADLMENDVSDARQALLSEQQNLLEARRQLGITNPAYQAALQRSAALLHSGKPLSKEEAQELQSLERQMTGIEQGLAQSSRTLSDQLTAMNMLRARVNARLDSLKAKQSKLKGMHRQIEELRGKLVGARGDLQTQRDGLLSHRAAILAQIEKLKNTPGIQGLAEYQQTMALLQNTLKDLDEQLKSFDTSLASADQSIAELDQSLGELDEVLAAADSLKSKLEMIQGKIDELIGDIRQLKQQVDQLHEESAKMLKDLQDTRQEVAAESSDASTAESPAATAQQPTGPANDPQLAQQRNDLQRQSFANRLSNQLTGFWSAAQRQTDSRREADHQARREALAKTLEARIKQAEQIEIQLKATQAQDQQLAEITAHLVEQALAGQNRSSGINVV